MTLAVMFNSMCRYFGAAHQLLIWHRQEFDSSGRLVDSASRRLVVVLMIAQLTTFIKSLFSDSKIAYIFNGVLLLFTIGVFWNVILSDTIQLGLLPDDQLDNGASPVLITKWWKCFKHPLVSCNNGIDISRLMSSGHQPYSPSPTANNAVDDADAEDDIDLMNPPQLKRAHVGMSIKADDVKYRPLSEDIPSRYQPSTPARRAFQFNDAAPPQDQDFLLGAYSVPRRTMIYNNVMMKTPKAGHLPLDISSFKMSGPTHGGTELKNNPLV